MQTWKRVTDSSELTEGQVVRYWRVSENGQKIEESMIRRSNVCRYYTSKYGWSGAIDDDGFIVCTNLFGGQAVEALFQCESYGDMPVLKDEIKTEIKVGAEELNACIATLQKIRKNYRDSDDRSRAQVIADAENLIATF